MIGILVGDLVLSASGYLLYLGGVAVLVGMFVGAIYWLIERFYFVLSGSFNFVFGTFFTLDDVCDVFISFLALPVDGAYWLFIHLMQLLAYISSFH